MDASQTTEDEVGEFGELDTFDLLAAYLHARHGEDALREVFSLIGCHREQLEETAEVLEQRGLDAVASIMREFAAEARSGIEANPYDPDSINGRCWAQSWLQKRWVESGEMEKSLRAQKARKNPKAKPYRH
jgi:hypothetical protein